MAKTIRKQKRLLQTIIFLVAGCCIPVFAAGAKAAPRLSKKTVTVAEGRSVKIKVLHVAKNTKVKWSVKNKKIAVVKKGKITGKKRGTTKVYALAGKKKLVCIVKVTAAEKKVSSQPKKTTVPDLLPKAAATAQPVPTATPTASTGSDNEKYEASMVSGSKEDFDQYFYIDSKAYTKRQEGVASGEMNRVAYESSVWGAAREAYVYTPAEYQEGTAYPVVYMLHGLGCDGTQWKGLNILKILDNMIARQEIQPVVVVFPSIVPKDGLAWDTFSNENIEAFGLFVDEFSEDLEPFIFEHYSVSRDREDTGVCGLSMGGMEALELGFSLQDRFNYIGSFSAAPTLDTSLLQYTDSDIRPELVLLCNGTDDGVVGDNPYQYHMVLTQNNVKHIWYQYPDGDHSGPVWINGAINFLLRAYPHEG